MLSIPECCSDTAGPSGGRWKGDDLIYARWADRQGPGPRGRRQSSAPDGPALSGSQQAEEEECDDLQWECIAIHNAQLALRSLSRDWHRMGIPTASESPLTEEALALHTALESC